MLLSTKQQWISFYLMLFAFGGLSLFTYGFFRLKSNTVSFASWNDLPSNINGESVNGRSLYLRHNKSRVILMMIDLLRHDFVSSKYMPYTSELIKNRSACLYTARVKPPTATISRIKAMTTGSIPNFINEALDMGRVIITEDSFLNQAKLNQKAMVFYGDNVWLRLFPRTFNRSYGTSSYMSHYSLMDQFVTRYLKTELLSNPKGPDWDLMILHYSGLNYIIQAEGLASPKILQKVLQMDNIIKNIMDVSMQWEYETVLIICGDHEITNPRGHGGASYTEMSMPLVITQRKGCYYKFPSVINQIDIAPTISYILQIPIPRTSTGQILLQVLANENNGDLSSRKALYALHYNAFVNMNALKKILSPEEILEKECHRKLVLAEYFFFDWLFDYKLTSKQAAAFYCSSLENISEHLKKSVEFDLFAMIAGIIILFQTLITQLLILIKIYQPINVTEYLNNYIPKQSKAINLNHTALFIFAIILWISLFFLSCGISQTESYLCKLRPQSFITVIAIILVVISNIILLNNCLKNFNHRSISLNLNPIEYFLVVGCMIQALSYGGTSFIEQEDQTWYYIWVSAEFFVLVYTGNILVEYFKKKSENATEIQDKDDLEQNMHRVGKWLLPQWVVLMLFHRFLRIMNQSENKLVSSKEIQEIISPLAISALLMIGCICINNLDIMNTQSKINFILTLCTLFCVLLYRLETFAIEVPFMIPLMNAVFLARIFWMLMFSMVIVELWSTEKHFKNNPTITNIYKDYSNKNYLFYLGKYINVHIKGKSSRKETIYLSKESIKTNSFEHPLLPFSSLSENLKSNETNKCRKIKILSSHSNVFLNIMILICSHLLKPHNIILIPCIYLSSNIINKILDHKLNSDLFSQKNCSSKSRKIFCKTIFHIWLGTVFYFYQGNSNNLASMYSYIVPGNIGLELSKIDVMIIAFQSVIHTFMGPLLAGWLLFTDCVQSSKNYDECLIHLKKCISIISVVRIYPLTVYTVFITFLRYHPFMWNVLAPKLLYDFTIMFSTIILILTVMVLCCIVNLKEKLNDYLESNTKKYMQRLPKQL